MHDDGWGEPPKRQNSQTDRIDVVPDPEPFSSGWAVLSFLRFQFPASPEVANAACRSSTARSRRRPRDAFTRIQSPGADQRATAAAAALGSSVVTTRSAGSPAAV